MDRGNAVIKVRFCAPLPNGQMGVLDDKEMGYVPAEGTMVEFGPHFAQRQWRIEAVVHIQHQEIPCDVLVFLEAAEIG
jgi:hypothetical protein